MGLSDWAEREGDSRQVEMGNSLDRIRAQRDDLLAALQTMLYWSTVCGYDDRMVEPRRAARAAIAKAEGGA